MVLSLEPDIYQQKKKENHKTLCTNECKVLKNAQEMKRNSSTRVFIKKN